MRLMRGILLLFCLGLSPVSGWAESERVNHDGGLAISGYDPTSYFTGTPRKGSSEWELEDAGVVYRFSSAAARMAFESNPERYLPAYGGWCAYAMLEGDKVDVDPESFKIVEDRLYLFYDGFWGDTLKRWNKKLAKTPESELVSQADRQWESIHSP